VNISEIQALFIPHINCGGVLFGPERSSPLRWQKKAPRRDGTRELAMKGVAFQIRIRSSV
jgi:hypothetical protein